MALDFPSSPTNGQKYPASPVAGVPTYTWDAVGQKWTTSTAEITSLYVAKAGDTMTGDLVVSKAIPGINLNKLSSGQTAYINGSTNALARWGLVLGDQVAESGSNAGSDFNLIRYNDAGAFVDVPLKISRATSGVTTTGTINISPAAGASALVLNKPASGQDSGIYGLKGGLYRWVVSLGSTTAETGSNVGSDFMINRYNDAGTYIDSPVQIARSSAFVTLSGGMSAGGSISSAANVTASSGTVSAVNVTATGSSNGPQFLVTSQNAWLMSASSQSTFYTNTSTCYFNYYKASGEYSWAVNSAQMARIQGSGDLVVAANGWKPGGGVWADINSDIRVKNIEGAYELGLAEVVQLTPVHYTFKGNETNKPPTDDMRTDHEKEVEPREEDRRLLKAPYRNSDHHMVAKDEKKFVGLIAQEVEKIFPSMVGKKPGYIDGEPVPDLRYMDLTELTFAIVNSIKELNTRLEALEAA